MWFNKFREMGFDFVCIGYIVEYDYVVLYIGNYNGP